MYFMYKWYILRREYSTRKIKIKYTKRVNLTAGSSVTRRLVQWPQQVTLGVHHNHKSNQIMPFKRICFITPEDAAFGFGMAGIDQRVTRPEQADDTLRQVMAEGAIGLAILDERLLAAIPEETLRQAESRWPGILVVLPAPMAAATGGEYVNRLVARAIGYQVRLT